MKQTLSNFIKDKFQFVWLVLIFPNLRNCISEFIRKSEAVPVNTSNKFTSMTAALAFALTASGILSAQTPTLIGQFTYTTKGAGAAGVPSFSYNIPAGKNRLMIVTAYFERDHVTVGTNYPGTNADATPVLRLGASDFIQYVYNYRFYGSTSSSSSTAYMSSSLYSYDISDQYGLPTGVTTFSFPSMVGKPPLSAGDDVVISISVYENARQNYILTNLVGNNADAPSSSSTFSALTVTAPAPPVGTTQANILYLAHGAISQESVVSNSADWIDVNSVFSSNNLGQNYAGFLNNGGFKPDNEADGIAMKTVYRTGVTGNPSITFSRASTTKIMNYMGRITAILPLARPSVSGTVYIDNNGLTGGISNGGTGGGVWATANTLYVNAVDGSGNVLATALVSNIGVFSFPSGGNLIENDVVRFQLSRNQGLVGQPAPVKELPDGYITVGESTASGTSDGTPDGEFTLTIGATNSASNIINRFGVTGCPTGTVGPSVYTILETSCLQPTVNLNSAHTGTIPTNTTLVWYTTINRAAGTQVTGAGITAAGAGTYYAFYYSSASNCYSPASALVVVQFDSIDSDGDGVYDLCDQDDDNDGILDTDEDICSKPNQIVNGDFSASPASASWISSFSTNTPNTSGPLNYTGSAANILVDNPGTLYPGNILLANTSPFTTRSGVAYSFSSTLNIIPGGTTNTSFSWVLIDSSNNIVKVIQTYKTQASGTGNVQINNTSTAYPVTFIAPGTGNYRLALTWITNSSSSGNAQDVRIDNVTLLAPCDTDGDGIPNYLDLDSDNDGCPDAIEGVSTTITPSNLLPSSIPGGNSGATSGTFNQPVTQNLGNTVNTTVASPSYGVPTIAGTGQAIGTSQTANPVLNAGTAGANQTINSGSSPAALTLTGSSGVIQWQVSTDNINFANVASGGTTASYSPGTLTATRYYRAIITSVGGCTATSNVVTITVNAFDCIGKIYSLAGASGEIRAFTDPATSGALGTVVNTTPYPQTPASSANGANAMGYSNLTKKFYYVQIQATAPGNNTFVSYDPATNLYETLAGTTGIIYRGTVTTDGTGYYAITNGNVLKYYSIANNTWTTITSTYVDQNGVSLNTLLGNYAGGDIAMDGNGDLWILAGQGASPTAYVFRAKSTVPTTGMGSTPLVLEQIVKQDIGSSPNGIAFSPTGQLYITNVTTLFRMNDDFTISAIGAISPAGGGGDLASCAFPVNPFAVSDFGDAPDTYKTILASDGPRHMPSQYDATTNTASLMIGSTIDLEIDGIPNVDANGDDLSNVNDENSISITTLFINSTSYTTAVPVVNNTGGNATLRGWIDFNKNGIFDSSESATVTVPNGATSASLTWTGLSGLTAGDTYYRLRIAKNAADITLPTGSVFGGEVEDGKLTIQAVCYEDPALVAGATYPVRHGVTLLGRAGANNGNWPMLRNSAYTALESKTKGFVVTRNSSPETTIAIPVVGMMVFDTDENAGAGCLKIYTGPAAGEGWKCFNTQGCP